MTSDIIRRLVLFLVLFLVQVLVFNHIHLFGCVTPLLYIYMVIPLPRNYPRWAALLWGFLLGLGVDIFSNTPGVASASLTATALLQPYILELFLNRDSDSDLIPSIRSLGPLRYGIFSLILSMTYSILFFTLETFNFFNWLLWVTSSVGSGLVTWLFILVIDNLRKD